MKLPCKECGGQCCNYVSMSQTEFDKIRLLHGIPKGSIAVDIQNVDHYDKKVKPGSIGIMVYLQDGTCPWLKDGACSIYKDRPQVCIDYGRVKELPCKYLYPEKAQRQVQASMERAKIRELSFRGK